jgi:hypothetical protein
VDHHGERGPLSALKVHFADEKESKKFRWPPETLVIDEWLLLKYAVCFLPANQGALVESVSSNVLLQDGVIGLEKFLFTLFAKAIAWFEEFAFPQGNGVGKV